MPSEAYGQNASSKCCSKGKLIGLRKQFDNLQNRPLDLRNLLESSGNQRQRQEILHHSMNYNDQLAFGIVRIERNKKFPESYKIIKCNNMIQYLLWDFNPPSGQHQPALRGQLFTIPPQYAQKRLEEIARSKKLQVFFI